MTNQILKAKKECFLLFCLDYCTQSWASTSIRMMWEWVTWWWWGHSCPPSSTPASVSTEEIVYCRDPRCRSSTLCCRVTKPDMVHQNLFLFQASYVLYAWLLTLSACHTFQFLMLSASYTPVLSSPSVSPPSFSRIVSTSPRSSLAFSSSLVSLSCVNQILSSPTINYQTHHHHGAARYKYKENSFSAYILLFPERW